MRLDDKASVNRKEFHYLLIKFLQKYRISHIFYDCSIRFKFSTTEGANYTRVYNKFKFRKEDSFSEHLYKCIDVYCYGGNTSSDRYIEMYWGSISGFFQLIPATFYFTDNRYTWRGFWEKYSEEWIKEVGAIKFKDDNHV